MLAKLSRFLDAVIDGSPAIDRVELTVVCLGILYVAAHVVRAALL